MTADFWFFWVSCQNLWFMLFMFLHLKTVHVCPPGFFGYNLLEIPWWPGAASIVPMTRPINPSDVRFFVGVYKRGCSSIPCQRVWNGMCIIYIYICIYTYILYIHTYYIYTYIYIILCIEQCFRFRSSWCLDSHYGMADRGAPTCWRWHIWVSQ